MTNSDNNKVNNFLTDLQSVSSDKIELVESIRALFLGATEKIT